MCPAAGKQLTDEELEDMLESDNVAIFTQDVSSSVFFTFYQFKYSGPSDFPPIV